MYPVYVKEIAKEETKIDNVDEICQFFINKVNAHAFAKYIGIFNHYAHTESIDGGETAENIKDAKNILFCFGKKLPDPKMLAVRPRSIGVCETNSHFVISFLEAPNPALTEIMILWLEEMLNQ
ncbi:MAG: hypothetical protein KAR07_08490 [Spirochaetes bacterium]|nr:hypothetical protein [Spirochaetota bacterium]